MGAKNVANLAIQAITDLKECNCKVKTGEDTILAEEELRVQLEELEEWYLLQKMVAAGWEPSRRNTLHERC